MRQKSFSASSKLVRFNKSLKLKERKLASFKKSARSKKRLS